MPMSRQDFIHLHLHTDYSLLDGACKISHLVDLAARYKMPAVAVTDHGKPFRCGPVLPGCSEPWSQTHHRL